MINEMISHSDTTKYIVFAANGEGRSFNVDSPEEALRVYQKHGYVRQVGAPVQVVTVGIVNGLFLNNQIQDVRETTTYEVV